MKALLQRVSKASVHVGDRLTGEIQKGFLILLGITQSDTEKDLDLLLEKIVNLRIFEDEEQKMNKSLIDVGGSLLIVSQFTLYADCKKGRRPSFTDAARPEQAIELYKKCIEKAKVLVPNVQEGEFGAMMDVALVNDGPTTIMLETKEGEWIG
ncbi:D-tyrosyl-tRNA(Tyr) deacylase [Candidatus Gracilibacteria bacterium]|nr:D-tyrosyl-tRNA(Tyr) deacylase [Candidatus Gracilibacteria bacterium]